MGHPDHDNLPEALPPPPLFLESLPDSSPQALTPYEAGDPFFHAMARDKFPAYFDDAPKYPSGEHQPVSPWASEPMTAVGYQEAVAPWETLPISDAPEPPHEESRILGLRRKTFFIGAVVAFVMIGAAIGGGIAGAAKMRGGNSSDISILDLPASTNISGGDATTSPTAPPSKSSSTPIHSLDSSSALISSAPSIVSGSSSSILPTLSSVPSDAQTPSSTPTTSISSTTTTTTTTTPKPTPKRIFLNNGTAPEGPAFQAFSGKNYTGEATGIIRSEGFHQLPFPALSYVWLPDAWTYCLTFCDDETTPAGWFCDPRFRDQLSEGSSGLERIHLWSGRGNDEEEEKKKRKQCS